MISALAIGIAGGSGAGKTALARRLAEVLGGVSLLDLDSYYLDRSEVSPESRRLLNFDEPSAFDVNLLMHHLRRLRDGYSVEKPRYSFEDHVRTGVEQTSPAPIVVVEGLFALWWGGLRDALDLKIYVDAPASLRLQRRIRRDGECRGRSVESVLRQYEATVHPMHEVYVAPTRAYADVVLVNDGDVDSCLEALYGAIETARPRWA